jgi:hypothetical protein
MVGAVYRKVTRDKTSTMVGAVYRKVTRDKTSTMVSAVLTVAASATVLNVSAGVCVCVCLCVYVCVRLCACMSCEVRGPLIWNV